MTSLLILLSVCSAVVVGTNETLNNEITNDEKSNLQPETMYGETVGKKGLEKVFKDAVQSYLEEDWDGCIEGFSLALHGFKVYKRMVANCRQKCRTVAAGATPLFRENIEDLHFYERKVRETLCLLACNQEYREIAGSKALKRVSLDIEGKLMDQRVYEYLHICYYKKNRYQDAANAVFTFLVSHPNHAASVETLKHYLTLPDVSEENVVNLEAAYFVTLYFKGISAYEDEYYKEAAGLFESSLRSYLESEEECRLYCERPFDQGWNPEFTSSVANHFVYCLKCKRGCSRSLNTINGVYRNDILRSHYDYLQFSYYKLGKLKAACAAVESFLLFEPADETMLHNKEYYGAQPKVTDDYFTPREEALSYAKRQEYEIRLLRFISDEFSIVEARLEEYIKKTKKEETQATEEVTEKELGKESISRPMLHSQLGHSPTSQTQLTGNLSVIRNEENEIRRGQDTLDGSKVRADVYLIGKEEELGGRNRYVADGFLNSSECQSLMQLALIAAVEGDGYDKNKSPHSVYERFEGITVGRAALMVYFGQLEPERLELLLESTEMARDHVERYFELDRELYFTYTHLVCRTALPDSPINRDDLSHQVHADNCLLKEQDVCSTDGSAYIWRDYSAIVYLNDDFEGGEFFFAKDPRTPETKGIVSPQCGRMVAFSAGKENLHGVRGVLRGRRCALALWFTHDERYYEQERLLARAILKRVRSTGTVQQKDFHVPVRYEDVLIQHFKKDELLKQFLRESS